MAYLFVVQQRDTAIYVSFQLCHGIDCSSYLGATIDRHLLGALRTGGTGGGWMSGRRARKKGFSKTSSADKEPRTFLAE
jgi:hypothetical protein